MRGRVWVYGATARTSRWRQRSGFVRSRAQQSWSQSGVATRHPDPESSSDVGSTIRLELIEALAFPGRPPWVLSGVQVLLK